MPKSSSPHKLSLFRHYRAMESLQKAPVSYRNNAENSKLGMGLHTSLP